MKKKLNLPAAALVVEDDYMTALLCARALESLGLQVMCCETSMKATNVAQLYAHRIQFMLVDVVLASPEFQLTTTPNGPQDDGARVLSLLKHFCDHAVAVQMSAYSKEELTKYGYRIDAEHFLQKPFASATLRSLVKIVLPNLKVPS